MTCRLTMLPDSPTAPAPAINTINQSVNYHQPHHRSQQNFSAKKKIKKEKRRRWWWRREDAYKQSSLDDFSPLLRSLRKLTPFHSHEIFFLFLAWQRYIQLWPNHPSSAVIVSGVISSAAVRRNLPIFLRRPSRWVTPLLLLRRPRRTPPVLRSQRRRFRIPVPNQSNPKN